MKSIHTTLTIALIGTLVACTSSKEETGDTAGTLPTGTTTTTTTTTNPTTTTTTTTTTTPTNNNAPSAPVVVIDPESPSGADDLNAQIITASVDPDGDTVSYGYAWSVDGVEVPDIMVPVVSADRTAKGETWTVTVTPNDGQTEGAAATAEALVLNAAPTVTEVNIEPEDIFESSSLTCEGTGADADGDDLTFAYQWFVNDEPVSASEGVMDGRYFNKGDEITCQATPNDGETDGESAFSEPVTVQNSTPSVESVAITPNPATSSSILFCTWTGYADGDFDEDQSTVQWMINGEPGATTASISSGFRTDDVVMCEVTPFDGESSGVPVSSDAITISNNPPRIDTITVFPATARVGDTVGCGVSASDPDGEIPGLSYAWSSGATGSTYTLVESDDPGATITCTATATDGSGATDTASASATVLNTDPAFLGASITPDPAHPGDVMNCNAAVFDRDGGEPALSYIWSDSSTASTYTARVEDLETGSVFCVVTATDADGGSTGQTLFASVTNEAPVIGGLTISPDAPEVGDTVTCEADVVDPDGDDVTTSFAWSTGESDASIVVESDTPVGAELVCAVTATDSNGSAATDSVSVTVANTPPTVEVGVDSGGVEPDVGVLLSCVANVTDPNEDDLAVAYAWVNVTTSEALGETKDLVVPDSVAAGDVIRCVASTIDEWGASAFGSADVTIALLPLVVERHSITPPGAIVTGDNELTCNAFVTDPDGSEVTTELTWFVRGSTSITDMETETSGDSIVLSGFLTEGDVVTCVLIANSASGKSVVSSIERTVSNAGPNIVLYSFSPESPRSNEDVNLEFIPVDPEGDDFAPADPIWTNREGETLRSPIMPAGFAAKYTNPTATITLVDARGAVSVTTLAVPKILNSLPVAESVGVSSASPSPIVGDLVTCKYSYSDFDGDAEVVESTVIRWYEASSVTDPEFLAEGPSLVVRSTMTALICEVRVSDGEDLGVPAFSEAATVVEDLPDDDTTEASEDAPEEFALLDVNTSSPTYGEVINPRDYLGQVSAYYFGHAT